MLKNIVFLYDNHFRPLHQPKCCWDIVDNRAYVPICVLDDNDRETKISLKHTLKIIWWTEHFGIHLQSNSVSIKKHVINSIQLYVLGFASQSASQMTSEFVRYD